MATKATTKAAPARPTDRYNGSAGQVRHHVGVLLKRGRKAAEWADVFCERLKGLGKLSADGPAERDVQAFKRALEDAAGDLLPAAAGGEREAPFNFDRANPFVDPEGRPMPGICVVCGCEEDNPCPEGCGWANTTGTLCTVCADVLDVAAAAKRRGRQR